MITNRPSRSIQPGRGRDHGVTSLARRGSPATERDDDAQDLDPEPIAQSQKRAGSPTDVLRPDGLHRQPGRQQRARVGVAATVAESTISTLADEAISRAVVERR